MPKPHWSELFGEWVLVAEDYESLPEPKSPLRLGEQLSLLDGPAPERLTAGEPWEAWVVYRKREWPLLRRLEEEDRKRVHEVKRVFGGYVIEVA